jgi:hypothetical protein
LSPSRFSIRSSLEAVEHFATRVRRFQSSFDRELSTVGEHRNPNSLYPLTTTHHLLPIPSHQTTKSPPTPSNLTTSRRLIRMILLRYYSLTVKTILAIIPCVSQPKFAGHLLLPLSSSQVCARRLSRSDRGDLSALCVKIRALQPLPPSLVTRRSSLQESVSISFHATYAPFVFILLRTLLHSKKCYLQSLQ